MKKSFAILGLSLVTSITLPNLAQADDEMCEMFIDAAKISITLRQKGIPLDQPTIDAITNDAKKNLKPNAPEEAVAQVQALYLATAMLAYEEPIAPKNQRERAFNNFVSEIKKQSGCL